MHRDKAKRRQRLSAALLAYLLEANIWSVTGTSSRWIQAWAMFPEATYT